MTEPRWSEAELREVFFEHGFAHGSTHGPYVYLDTLIAALSAVGVGAAPAEGWVPVALLPFGKYHVEDVEEGWQVLIFDQRTADIQRADPVHVQQPAEGDDEFVCEPDCGFDDCAVKAGRCCWQGHQDTADCSKGCCLA